MSLLDLRRKRGDLWDAAAWNRHLEEIDRFLQNLPPGDRGSSRRSVAPGPVFLTLSADAGQNTGEWLVRVGFGLAAGVEPTIAGRRISEVDAQTGEMPALTVRGDDFSATPKNAGDWPQGVAFIYARATFDNPSWGLLAVEIIARATPWTVQPWKTARLIGLLRRDDPDDAGSDVSPLQLTLFNQALTLSQQGSAGRARYWWRATF